MFIHTARSKYDLRRHSIATSYGERCIEFKSIQLWNMLPNHISVVSVKQAENVVKRFKKTSDRLIIQKHNYHRAQERTVSDIWPVELTMILNDLKLKFHTLHIL